MINGMERELTLQLGGGGKRKGKSSRIGIILWLRKKKKKGTEKGFFGGGEGALWPTFNLSKSGRSPKPMGRDGWRHKCLTS